MGAELLPFLLAKLGGVAVIRCDVATEKALASKRSHPLREVIGNEGQVRQIDFTDAGPLGHVRRDGDIPRRLPRRVLLVEHESVRGSPLVFAEPSGGEGKE